MSNRLESYLEDLRGRLVRHFEPKRLDEVIAEMRSHVTYSARDAQRELDLEPDEAVRGALVALGPVEAVAEDLVRQHRGGTAKSEWQVIRGPLTWFVLAFLFAPHLFLLSGWRFLGPWALGGAALTFLPLVALVSFAAAVWRSRRWLVKPMAVGFLAIQLTSLFLYSTPGYQRLVQRRIGGTSAERAVVASEYEQKVKMAELGAKGYLESPDLFRSVMRSDMYYYPEVTEIRHPVVVPFLPLAIPLRIATTVSLSEGPWNPQRAEAWAQYGAAIRTKMVEEKAAFQEGRGVSYRLGGWYFPLQMAAHVGVLGLVNLAVLSASDRRRRRRARRDPHLA